MTEELVTQVSRIYERARNETLELIQSRKAEKIVIPVREWMSATQLAEYWQLYNDKSEPTTAGTEVVEAIAESDLLPSSKSADLPDCRHS
ncbi:MAG TPA: hypothetical protein VEW46_06260 [Pyrinomonadaceae bacterium]|nr:hypothetical protein [Pyrinomonadaceae bacterium]